MFNSFIQQSWVIQLTLVLITFFTPILTAMIAVGLLISIDTILGVLAARKNGESVTSKKFGRIITKALVYELLVIASHLTQVYLFPIVPFVNITLGFLAITEFLSIGENVSKITGTNFIGYFREQLDTKFRGIAKKDNTNTPTE